MNKATSLLVFPTAFPIKVFGYNTLAFETEILAIIKQQFPDIILSQLKKRPSQDNKYLAITITVMALNQQQLDVTYQALTANNHVIMAL